MEHKNTLKSKRKGFMLVVVAFLVVVALILYFGASVVIAEFRCEATGNYQYVESRIAQDSNGQSLYIVRGIYSTGEGSADAKKIILPVCSSKDPSIESVSNMFLTLDGKTIFLISGAIGREIASPLPELPQQ